MSNRALVRSVLVILGAMSIAGLLLGCGEGDTTTVIEEAEPAAPTTTTVQEPSGGDGGGGGQPAAAPEPAPEPEPEPAGGQVPDVVNERLDVAKSQVKAAGFSSRSVGGGLFGVVIESNWVVCEQEPAGGTTAEAGTKVDLIVDRTC